MSHVAILPTPWKYQGKPVSTIHGAYVPNSRLGPGGAKSHVVQQALDQSPTWPEGHNYAVWSLEVPGSNLVPATYPIIEGHVPEQVLFWATNSHFGMRSGLSTFMRFEPPLQLYTEILTIEMFNRDNPIAIGVYPGPRIEIPVALARTAQQRMRSIRFWQKQGFLTITNRVARDTATDTPPDWWYQ